MSGAGRASGSAVPSLLRLTPRASVLLIAAAGAWVYVAVLARDMTAMPGTMGLGIGSFVAVWTLMMAAMMLPSVAPFASLYTRSFGADRRVRLAAFTAGYLIVWMLAAIPAYGLAWLAGRLSATHPGAATGLAVTVFVACGVYQLTGLKERCLSLCRSPLGLAMRLGGYRGKARDLRAGLYHGWFCLACCWALMALLVAFGLMNVVAMVVLAATVLAEKTWTWGPQLSRVAGVAAVALAVAVIFEPNIATGLHGMAGTGQMGGM